MVVNDGGERVCGSATGPDALRCEVGGGRLWSKILCADASEARKEMRYARWGADHRSE